MSNINDIRKEERVTLQNSQQRYEQIHMDYRDVTDKHTKMQLEIDKSDKQLDAITQQMQALEKLGNMPESCVCPCTLSRPMH